MNHKYKVGYKFISTNNRIFELVEIDSNDDELPYKFVQENGTYKGWCTEAEIDAFKEYVN